MRFSNLSKHHTLYEYIRNSGQRIQATKYDIESSVLESYAKHAFTKYVIFNFSA